VCWFEQTEIHGRQKHSGKKDVSIHEPPLEMGFIDKLIEMFKFAKFLRDLKQEMEQSDGLSNGYARNERKFTADQIVSFQVYISSKELQTKHVFEFYVGIYTATNQTTLLQVFTNKNISSNSLKIRFPEDQPTNLMVKLILTLLMLPQ